MKMKGVWDLVTAPQILATAIFALTMLVIMTEKIHRTLAAVTGAILLILTGVLNVKSAFSYVDINTLGVLVGMMLFVTIVKSSGIFEYIAIRAAKIAKGRPWAIMAMFMVITALLSAFLDNVTTVLLIGPMTLVIILWVSAIVSSFLDNIPFVATLIPLILTMQNSGMDVTPLWWAVSLGACLGGNGTLIGASANVVLSGISTKHGYPITFGSYFKVGFPMMLVSIAISTVYLLLRYAY